MHGAKSDLIEVGEIRDLLGKEKVNLLYICSRHYVKRSTILLTKEKNNR